MYLIHEGVSSVKLDEKIEFCKKRIEANLIVIKDIENLQRFAKCRFDINIDDSSILAYEAENKKYKVAIRAFEKELIERMWRNVD